MTKKDVAQYYSEHVNPYLFHLLQAIRLDVHFTEGRGCRLRYASGREYLYFVAGYGALPFGHSPAVASEAIQKYLSAAAPTLIQPSLLGPASRLARRLAELAPGDLRYVTFANSGAESVEAAIKACRAAMKRPGVVYAQSSFHGKTLGALSATGAAKYQTPFYAPVPDFYAVPYGDLNALEALLAKRGRGIACVILEPIQGEGGVVVPPPGYLAGVRALCDRHDVLMILDEIQTGLGRTGTLFASEQEGVAPDCMTLSKALAAGMIPIGCVIMNERAFSSDFALCHSSTFAGNGLACEAALATLDALTDEARSPLANVRARGAQLAAGLQALQTRHPEIVVSVRGRGLLLGVELRYQVLGRSFGTILRALSEQGNLIPLVSSYLLNVHGIRTAPTLSSGHVLRIQPPLSVTEAECALFLNAMETLLHHLSRGDTGALAEHLIDKDKRPAAGHAWLSPEQEPVYTPPARRPEDNPIAFLIHPVEPRNLMDFDSSLRRFDETALRQLAGVTDELLEPFVAGQTRIEAGNAAVYMEFICLPQLPEALLAQSSEQAQETVARAVRLARDRGAKMVGLGAYTSIVTQGGARVTALGTAVTSGNTYTVITGLLAARYAAEKTRLEMTRAAVIVVGAAGMIGSSLVDSLLGKTGRLVLIGNPARPEVTRRRLIKHLETSLSEAAAADTPIDFLRRDARAAALYRNGDYNALAQAIVDRTIDVGVICDVDVNPYLDSADIVVCATSSTELLLDVARLKRGAIILDLSRPSNVDRAALDRRPDVLFIDGGVVAFPGAPDLGIDFGFPRGHGFACMAETAMLGLAGHFVNTSIGARVGRDTYRFIKQLAERFGFELAGLRSFNHKINESDWQAYLRARKAQSISASGGPSSADLAWVSAPAVYTIPGDTKDNLVNWLLHRHRLTHADKTALVSSESGETMTYSALWRRVAGAARRLSAAGFAQGDKVALVCSDSIDMAVAILACWWNGIVAVPTNPGLPASDYHAMLAIVNPNLVLHGGGGREAAAFASLGYRVEPVETWTAASANGDESVTDAAPLALALRSPAVCLFSSGSSGRPKAFLHSHSDFITMNLNYVPTVPELAPGARVFSPSRMFFAYGLNAVTFGLFAGGTSILAPKPGKGVRLREILRDQRANVVFAVPTVLKLMLEQGPERAAFPDLRLCISAGEPLPASLYTLASERLGVEIIDGIGTTEVLSTFVSNRPGQSAAGCTGLVVPGFEVRLINDKGETCRVGETGVLWVRGNTLTRGAFGDPALSAQVFQDDWFNTNDLFYMDASRRFYYVGRANDVLKINGCWVAPNQIEAVLCEHRQIAECAVVPIEDEYGLIRPKAVVVTRGEVPSLEALWQELKTFSKQRLGNHQYPHLFEHAHTLPRTASGKLQRFKLRPQAVNEIHD